MQLNSLFGGQYSVATGEQLAAEFHRRVLGCKDVGLSVYVCELADGVARVFISTEVHSGGKQQVAVKDEECIHVAHAYAEFGNQTFTGPPTRSSNPPIPWLSMLCVASVMPQVRGKPAGDKRFEVQHACTSIR